jgi:hypothetical protein
MQVGSPRRKRLLIGVGIVVLLAVGVAVVLLLVGTGTPTEVRGGGTSSEETAGPTVPAFRFSPRDRVLITTAPGRVKKRMRVAGEHAATATASLLSDLYREGFLDPANWPDARYGDAFRIFAGEARAQAEDRMGVLTAGATAAERFERVLPVSGHLTSRILLDRAGTPSLVVSLVRFRARAVGPKPAVLRSTGTFFFERVGGRWRVVSFDVTRDDRRAGAA